MQEFTTKAELIAFLKRIDLALRKDATWRECPECGGEDTEKIMSATSSLTGHEARSIPGPHDTGCCGQSPGQASCAGPGSCCGKAG